MTRAFLPLLHQSDDARLVNISSLFGLIAPPGQTAYVASKFAVRGFSESLRHELSGTRIGVTVVHPGGVATSIARNARLPKGMPLAELMAQRKSFDSFLKMPPEVAGETIVRGVENRKARVRGRRRRQAGRDHRAADAGHLLEFSRPEVQEMRMMAFHAGALVRAPAPGTGR